MLKRVRIKLVSLRHAQEGSLFDSTGVRPRSGGAEPCRMEIFTVGRYLDNGTRVSISYEESELTGLEGSAATLSFSKADPQEITMLRNGSVKTSLLFREGLCHDCIYQTALMPFEVRLLTKRVENGLEKDGVLRLDYTVEIKGAEPERTELVMTLLPDGEGDK